MIAGRVKYNPLLVAVANGKTHAAFEALRLDENAFRAEAIPDRPGTTLDTTTFGYSGTPLCRRVRRGRAGMQSTSREDPESFEAVEKGLKRHCRPAISHGPSSHNGSCGITLPPLSFMEWGCETVG